MKTLKTITSSLLGIAAILLFFSEPAAAEPSLSQIAIPKAAAFLCAFLAFRLYTGYWRPSKARH